MTNVPCLIANSLVGVCVTFSAYGLEVNQSTRSDLEIWQLLERAPTIAGDGRTVVRLTDKPFELRSRHGEARLCLSRHPMADNRTGLPHCLEGRRFSNDDDALTISDDGYNALYPLMDKQLPSGQGVVAVRYFVDIDDGTGEARTIPLVQQIEPLSAVIWIDTNQDKAAQEAEIAHLDLQIEPDFLKLIPRPPAGWTLGKPKVRAYKSALTSQVEGFFGLAAGITGTEMRETVFDTVEIEIVYSRDAAAGTLTLGLVSMDINTAATIQTIHENEEVRAEAMENGIEPFDFRDRQAIRQSTDEGSSDLLMIRIGNAGVIGLLSAGDEGGASSELLAAMDVAALEEFFARPEEWRPR